MNNQSQSTRDRLLDEISVNCFSTEGDRIQRLVADVYAGLPSHLRRKAMERIKFWLLADAAFPSHLYFPVPPKATVVETTFVVIPGDFLKYGDRKLRTTIAHEVAHIL